METVYTMTMQEILNYNNCKIIYQKVSEMSADYYLSQNVIYSIRIEYGWTQGKSSRPRRVNLWRKKWMLNGTQVSNIKAKTYLNYYWANRSFLEYNLFWVGLQYWGEQLRVCLVLPPSEINKVLNKWHNTLFSAHKWSCCKNQSQSDSKLLVALYGQRYWRVHQTLWKISKTL